MGGDVGSYGGVTPLTSTDNLFAPRAIAENM